MRRGVKRLQRPPHQPAAVPAAPAAAHAPTTTTDDAFMRRARLRQVVDELKAQETPPSYAAATRYRVDPARYTSKERRAADHAMDFNGQAGNALTFVESTGFPGFPTLSLLAQLPEYRSMHERLADECVRLWGHVKASDSTPAERLEAIESELRRLKIHEHIRQVVVHDQAFGGAHVYFKLKNDQDFRDTPLVMRPYTVRKGSFEGVRVVEPYWVTPNFYNSIDPTAPDFYKPSSWWMIGLEVHATRLQTVISRPVPDMLKPTYSFRGISMTQLAMQYVDNWLRTRQAVSDTVKQFSITGVLTDMQQALAPGGSTDLNMRAEYFNLLRDSRNVAFLDKATEEFFQINTPLSGLSDLQAQAQEQMSAVSHIPLVVLLGITPTGLNASSDGEVRVWYDYVAGYQKNTLLDVMHNILRLVQLSLFGEIDESIFWEWEPLYELTALEEADRQLKEAETDARYIEAGVLAPQQVADRLNSDQTSMYAGTLTGSDLDDIPDDDIAGITDAILEIGDPAAAGAAAPAPGATDPATNANPEGAQPDDPATGNTTGVAVPRVNLITKPHVQETGTTPTDEIQPQ